MRVELYVGSIPFGADAAEIRAFVEASAPVVGVRKLHDPATQRFRGIAFVMVDVRNEDDARLVAERLSGRELVVSTHTWSSSPAGSRECMACGVAETGPHDPERCARRVNVNLARPRAAA